MSRLAHAQALARRLASLAAAAPPAPAAAAECVTVAPGAPPLLRLAERPWGPAPALPAGAAPPGAASAAVVREAFAADGAPARRLADALAPLGGGGAVAVAPDLAAPRRRMVVDVYEGAPGGPLRLRSSGTDLLRFLGAAPGGLGLRLVLAADPAAAAAAAAAAPAARPGASQCTNEVLMVAPTAFAFNDQAAADNSFMHASAAGSGRGAGQGGGGGAVRDRVLREFAGLHHELTERAGVRVRLFAHGAGHGTPDACFPNNWFSTHAAGEAAGGVRGRTLVLYPMKCPNRAAERRADARGVLGTLGYDRVVDMTRHEAGPRPRYFEGTGSLVLDRARGVAYVALSERADAALAEEWVAALGYREAVTFRSTDAAGAPVYHTNVMMAVGTGVAVACLESVDDDKERRRLRASLEAGGRAVVDISRGQMAALCGNVLELRDGRGLPVLALSTRAYRAFTEDQRRTLRRHLAELHHAPIDTLEHIGGGGVRCTLAEIF